MKQYQPRRSFKDDICSHFLSRQKAYTRTHQANKCTLTEYTYPQVLGQKSRWRYNWH